MYVRFIFTLAIRFKEVHNEKAEQKNKTCVFLLRSRLNKSSEHGLKHKAVHLSLSVFLGFQLASKHKDT